VARRARGAQEPVEAACRGREAAPPAPVPGLSVPATSREQAGQLAVGPAFGGARRRSTPLSQVWRTVHRHAENPVDALHAADSRQVGEHHPLRSSAGASPNVRVEIGLEPEQPLPLGTFSTLQQRRPVQHPRGLREPHLSQRSQTSPVQQQRRKLPQLPRPAVTAAPVPAAQPARQHLLLPPSLSSTTPAIPTQPIHDHTRLPASPIPPRPILHVPAR
jgi:hypothetical protein